MRSVFRRVAGWWLCMNMCLVSAQIPDSIPPAMPASADSMAALIMAASDSSLRADSTQLKPEKVRPENMQERLQLWKTTLLTYQPKVLAEGKKTKLKLVFPGVEDPVVIPWPKGFTNVGLPPPYDPQVAYQRALLIPGYGQAYNRAYWKIPIFYAGYAAALGWISYTQSQYIRFRRGYFWEVDTDPASFDQELRDQFDAQGMRTQREQFRKWRDYGFLALIGWHGLTALEAYVDAHLNGFDVSEDLSLKLGPSWSQPSLASPTSSLWPGLQLSIRF
ncbi:MAG: DUF5683 domain-containing protein [Bacteroidota bacterium]